MGKPQVIRALIRPSKKQLSICWPNGHADELPFSRFTILKLAVFATLHQARLTLVDLDANPTSNYKDTGDGSGKPK